MMTPPHHLLIRADASPASGIGHIMRCLAIAQAARDAGHTVTLVTTPSTPTSLCALWHDEGIHLETLSTLPGSADDGQATQRIAIERNATCILVDGYSFDETFFNRLAPDGGKSGLRMRTAALHDLPGAPIPATDLLINPNPGVTTTHYPSHRTVYCGSDYTPLQRHIAALAAQPRPTDSRILLASFGGSDSTQLSEWLCIHVEQLRAANITLQLVCGPTNIRSALLQNFLTPTTVFTDVTPTAFAHRAHLARAALVAAGSTCWELAALGVPQWAITTAPNQQIVAEGLNAHQWGRISSRACLPTIEDIIEWFEYTLTPKDTLGTGGAAQCVKALLE